jgi:hypothetical protein
VYDRTTNIYTLRGNSANAIEHPSVSNYAEKLAWLQKVTATSNRIYVRDLQAAVSTLVINTSSILDHPHLSADGNYLTYAQAVSPTRFVVYDRNLTTNQQVQPVSTTASLTAPYWQFPDEFAVVTKVIGIVGGELVNGKALIQVPANALSGDVTFTIQKVETLPATLPSPLQRVSAYKISSNATQDFTSLISVVIPIDISTTLPADQVITELYTWDSTNNKYEKDRIEDKVTSFGFKMNKLSSYTFVAGRATKTELSNDCTTKGGQFNGKYCQLLFSSSSPVFTAQAVGRNYTILSINVGNFGRAGTTEFDYCLKYAVKLCSYAVEERVRNALVQANADIIAIQEVWHSDCLYVEETGVPFLGVPELLYYTDRVCTTSSTQQTLTQLERLLLDNTFTKESKYEWRCTQPVRLPNNTVGGGPKTVNGYERIAVRKELFELVGLSPATIQPPCDPNSADPTQNYLGRDTGFQVETVRLKNPIGEAQYAEFDVVNSHMFSAFGISAAECRQVQLSALRTRYYPTSAGPLAKRLLLMGDFNTDAIRNANVQPTDVGRNRFNTLFSPVDASIDLFPYTKTAYLLSNPNELTASFLGSGFSLDHVLSNFADGTCARGESISGLDHKRTLCTLRGFDSGTAQFLMLLWDTSTSPVQYNLWNGIVTPAKKGVRLTYAPVTYPSLGRHVISGIPNDSPIILETKACRFGTYRNLNVPVAGQVLDPGQILVLPEQRFQDNLPICQ